MAKATFKGNCSRLPLTTELPLRTENLASVRSTGNDEFIVGCRSAETFRSFWLSNRTSTAVDTRDRSSKNPVTTPSAPLNRPTSVSIFLTSMALAKTFRVNSVDKPVFYSLTTADRFYATGWPLIPGVQSYRRTWYRLQTALVVTVDIIILNKDVRMIVIRRVICLDGNLSRLRDVGIITSLPSNSETTQQVCENSVSLLSHNVCEFDDLQV